MKTYTGWQYLLIDAANHMGLDKLTFEERIQWATHNLNNLEQLADQAAVKPLFIKSVMAIRKTQRGEATGHLVSLDAVCSGIQIMSAITGCKKGAEATGLVDPDKRADAYGELQNVMKNVLGPQFSVNRSDAKDALMTTFYGSKAKPKQIFGEDTPELNAFYEAASTQFPGAWELLQELLASWQDGALMHNWKLPDGFDARVKVMIPKDSRVEVDELDHATFTYQYYENQGVKKGHRVSKANAANVVHSIDAYILRTLVRRCNYDTHHVTLCWKLLSNQRRTHGILRMESPTPLPNSNIEYYVDLWKQSGMVDVTILNHINKESVCYVPNILMDKLIAIIETMLAHAPFEIVTVHDEFKCHANNMNYLRQHYINIFAELAESEILTFILNQIHGITTGKYTKLSQDLSKYIRQSNYALS